MNSGASVPPDVPLPSEIDQEMNFIRQSIATKPTLTGDCVRRRDDVGDVVVADAERARREVPDDADGDRADRRPPHPVDRQVLERVLDRVDRAGDEHATRRR